MTEMTEQRFKEILSAYGAAPAHWPEGERSAAQEFLSATPSAKLLLSEEMALDAWMSNLPDPGISEAAKHRILGIPDVERTETESRDLIKILTGWRPIAGLSSALACGLLLGLFLGPVETTADEYDTIDNTGLTAIGTSVEEQ